MTKIIRLETVGHGPKQFMAVMDNGEALGGWYGHFLKGDEALIIIEGDSPARVNVRKYYEQEYSEEAQTWAWVRRFDFQVERPDGTRSAWLPHPVSISQYFRPDKRYVLRQAITLLYTMGV